MDLKIEENLKKIEIWKLNEIWRNDKWFKGKIMQKKRKLKEIGTFGKLMRKSK